MRSIFTRFICLLSVILSLTAVNVKEAQASHAMGADMWYECIGPNTFRITVAFYRDCSGIDEPAAITASFSSTGGCAIPNVTLIKQPPVSYLPGATLNEISPLCGSYLCASCCQSSPCPPIAPPCLPGVQRFLYEGTVVVPPGCDMVTASISVSARNTSITNLSTGGNLYVTTQFNSDTCSDGPQFDNYPVLYVCDHQPQSASMGTTDADGDSLWYELSTPLGTGGAPLSHIVGLSYLSPLVLEPGTSFGFDNYTGTMTFTPGGSYQYAVVTILVYEYRDGELIGVTTRDIQIVVLPNTLCNTSIPNIHTIASASNGFLADTTTVQVCPGSNLTVNIPVTDPAGNNLTVSSPAGGLGSVFTGATFTQVGSGDSVMGVFNWTPLPSDTGCHTLLVNAVNDGCPVTGSSAKTFRICVFSDVKVSPDSAVYCGTPVPLSAVGGSIFTWTPPTGLDDPTSFTPNASPSTPTMYTFTSDCGSDSVFVDVNPPFDYSAGPDDTICQNGIAFLNATTDMTYAPYSFEWVPPTALTHPISGFPDNTIPNPAASPLSTRTYELLVTGANGCVRRDTLTVFVSGLAPRVVATADPDTVCPGDLVNLDTYSNPQSCGIPTIPCAGTDVLGTIGTGAAVTGGSPTQYPSIYGNWGNSSRTQILYHASEILAAIGSGGTIKSLAFDIGTFYSSAVLEDFTIRLKCTDVTDLTAWQTGLTTVFSHDVTPVNGWNTHVFDSYYNWDGTSNLVVEICYNSPSNGNFNNKLRYTPTTYNSMLYNGGNGSQCANAALPNPPTVNRFNTRFNVCVESLAGTVITWTPNTGPNAVSDSTIGDPTANPIAITTYHIDADDGGCVGSSFITVYVDTSVVLTARPDTFVCGASTTVNLLADLNVAAPPTGGSFGYNWSSSPPDPTLTATTSASPTVTPATPTWYYVTVTGATCVLVDSVFVNLGTNVPLTNTAFDISCFGANDGSINITPAGGFAPFTYNWSDGPATGASRTGLSAGTYYVTLTDNAGCQGFDTITITEPAVLDLTVTGTDLACNGDEDGTATATVTGGTTPYSYSWNASASTASSIGGLDGGWYAVTVTDDNGCTAIDSVFVTEPPALTLVLTRTNVSSSGAADGTASSVVGGGTPPYSYNWTPTGLPSTPNLSSLDTGMYVLTVSDAAGCVIRDTVFITEPPPIDIIASSTNNPCNGDALGSITIGASGGTLPYSYLWSTGDTTTTITDLIAGPYTITITDSSGASVDTTIIITEPMPYSYSFADVQVSCFGGSDGSATITVGGGTSPYSYDWSTGSTTTSATGLSAGVYTVEVTDDNGCIDTFSTTITEPTLLTATVALASVTDVSCNGLSDGSATVTAAGGTPPYTYTWPVSGSSATNSSLPAGFHTVTVTDDNGCVATDTFTINEPPAMAVAMSHTDASCNTSFDGTATVTPSGGVGGFTYAWSTTPVQTTATATGLTNTSYTVTVTDANGCTITGTSTIGTTYTVALSFGTDSALCFGSNTGTAWTVASNGTAPYMYAWSTTPPQTNDTAVNLNAGTYSVVVTDDVGCTATGSTTVQQPTQVTATASGIPPSCAGFADGEVSVVANGGYAPYTYLWSDPAASTTTTVTGLPIGTYSVTVTDANGCTAVSSYTLTPVDPLTADIINPEQESCYGYNDGSMEVTIGGGTTPYDIMWNTGDVTPAITGLGFGEFIVTVTDANGCIAADTQALEPRPILEILATDTDSVSCYGYSDGSVVINATGGALNAATAQYSLDGANWQNNPVIGGLPAGDYTAYVMDENGCTAEQDFVVYEPLPLFIELDPDSPVIELGAQVQLNTTFRPYGPKDINFYSWSPVSGLSCIDCPNPIASPYVTTIYELYVNYRNNCDATATIEVFVNEGPDFYVPNAFTPNGDGWNDMFQIYGTGIQEVKMEIFDRWGEKVFEGQSQEDGWDGFYKGQLAPQGVYVYYIEVMYLDGYQKSKKGSVTLIR